MAQYAASDQQLSNRTWELINKRTIMPGMGSLANYSGLVKSGILEENRQPRFTKPTDKCSLYTSSRKLLFATDEDHYRNHSWSKCRDVKQSPWGYIGKTLVHLRLSECCGRGEGKVVRARESGNFLVTSEAISTQSQ